MAQRYSLIAPAKEKHQWRLAFYDHLGRFHKISVGKTKKRAETAKARVESIVEDRKQKVKLSDLDREWLETNPGHAEKFADWGIVERARLASTRDAKATIEEWLETRRRDRKAESTLDKNSTLIWAMFRYLKWKTLLDITPKSVAEFVAHKEKTDEISTAASAGYTITAKQFVKWCFEEGYLSENTFARVRAVVDPAEEPRRPRVLLSPAEEQTLFPSMIKINREHHGLTANERMLCYLLALYAGLRWQEVWKLEPRDIQRDEIGPFIRVRNSAAKTRKADTVEITESLYDKLLTYIKARPETAGKRLFPITGEYGAAMLAEDLKDAGLEYETEEGYKDFHALRHTFGTRLARQGVPMHVLKRRMRHSRIQMTEKYYLHVEREDERRALLAETPLVPRLGLVVPVQSGSDRINPVEKPCQNNDLQENGGGAIVGSCQLPLNHNPLINQGDKVNAEGALVQPLDTLREISRMKSDLVSLDKTILYLESKLATLSGHEAAGEGFSLSNDSAAMVVAIDQKEEK